MFSPDFELSTARPAKYNPRRINPESAKVLRESLATLGILKALIVAGDGLLLAGHQRTNQIRALGIKKAPAVLLKTAVVAADQARFNQLHNQCDLDFAAAGLRIEHPLQTGWQYVKPRHVAGTVDGYASEKSAIARLLARYGPWGNVVATTDGRIIVGGLYAFCCALLRMPLLVCAVPVEREAELLKFFGRPYGEFSYDHIERRTWIQSMAQMYRLRDCGNKVKTSRTYENFVIPSLRPGLRILDFGAGQLDYVKLLQAQGVEIHGLEFYYRNGGLIDVAAVHRQIDQLCAEIRDHGLFDLVVCDSVLNSVDSQQAEDDVLTTISALCRDGGTVIFSGRCREDVRLRQGANNKRRAYEKRTVEFFDENGFSAMPKGNSWHFQKFHRRADVESLAARFVGDDLQLLQGHGVKPTGEITLGSWRAKVTKTRQLPTPEILAALRREFDLPLPDGTRYGRGDDIVSAYLNAKI